MDRQRPHSRSPVVVANSFLNAPEGRENWKSPLELLSDIEIAHKIERYHRSMKNEINLQKFFLQWELGQAIGRVYVWSETCF